MLDWTNETCKVTANFTVQECLYLHQWNRLAHSSDGLNEGIYTNLIALCNKLETVRALLQQPINVHCMFRSPEYNQLIGAPAHDVHSMGMACDFDCSPGLDIQEIKERLRPVLERYNIRIEKGTTTWVHLDIHPLGPSGWEFTP